MTGLTSPGWRRTAVAWGACAALLAGCAQGNKQATGTVLGAGMGAIVGSEIAGSKGAKVGALLGALVGSQIGALLDEQDRKQMLELEQVAASTNQRGAFVTKNGGRVSVEAGRSVVEDRRPFAFAAGVSPRRVVVGDTRTVEAYVNTPLYATPSEGQPPRLTISQGVPLTVVAAVQNLPNWVVVGDGNVGMGYLPTRYLQPDVAQAQAQAQAPRPVPSRPAPGPGAGRQQTRGSNAPSSPSSPSSPSAPPVVVASQAPATRAGSGPVVVASQTKAPSKASTPASNAPAPGKAGASKGNAPVVAKAQAPSPAVKTTTKDEYQTELERTRAAAATKPGTSASGSGVAVVQAGLECKVVKRRYTAPNSQETLSEDVKYCNEPPKGWQAITA